MRRIFACVLALMLLGCAALGEAGSFSFRNGVVWGMTEDEVLAAEGWKEWKEEWTVSDSCINGYCGSVPVAGALEAYLNYIFLNGQLAAASYDFDLTEEDTVRRLADALEVKYGSPEGPDEAALIEMASKMYEEDVEDLPVFESYVSWALEDGTWIALVVLTGGYAQLVYMDTVAISENAPVTLTTEGL